ncbi:MAG: hypothetical protein KAH32_09125, partial [Chlamydiia bacterium]|nr:hypothetical protein [Chlamydiia bacterium]
SCNFVELSADTLNISETGGESIITATLTDGTTTGDVKINLSFSGTADPLSYECLASITIPEGQTSASVKLTTKKFDNDSDKTVKVSIESIIHFDIREFGKQQFTILINNENDAPTNISLEESFFEEHINKSLLTKIIVDDVDDLTHLVTLIEGDGSDDNDQFRVVNSILYKNIVFDFEIKNTYSIRVKAEDPEGLSIEKVLIITIIDIEDFPTDITLNSSSFNESSTISHLANFIVEDKPGKTHNITLIDGHDSDDNDDFSITGTSLIRNIDFDYESKKEYKIRVKAEDSGGFFIEKSFILTIINFNDIEIDGDIVNPFCSSDDTGSISITVQQAIPPLAYSWSSGETTANISGKTVGTYSLTVTDAENMIKTKEFVIESPLIYSDLSIC